MIVTTTMELMYAAILANRYDDTPRLVYCDALEETDDPDNIARAEFIRKQIELAQIGPPPLVIDDVLVGMGQDYYTVTVTNDDLTTDGGRQVTVGGRVTVRNLRPAGNNKRAFWDTHHCLRVMKIEPDDPSLETNIVTLKRDEYSKPYPSKHVRQLTKRCWELIVGVDSERTMRRHRIAAPSKLAQLWSPTIPPYGELVGDQISPLLNYRLEVTVKPPTDVHRIEQAWLRNSAYNRTLGWWEWNRGFISKVTCTWMHWDRFGDYLVKHAPICDVFFRTHPQWVDIPAAGIYGGKYERIVRIADQHINYVADEVKKIDSGEWSEWQTHCSRRWPSIPVDCWRMDEDYIPLDEPYNEGDFPNGDDDWQPDHEGETDEF